MQIQRPKALKQGDVIGIAAPASAVESSDRLMRGIVYLERVGYRIKVGKNVHRKHGYLAGSDAQRVFDLHELFANKHVKAIFTVRGGYGSQKILPLLNYNLIQQNPKIIVGFSDITALQLALFNRTGLITFSGPMVAGELATGLSGNAEDHFWQCLTSTKPLGPIRNPNQRPFKVLRHGRSTGRIIGGNLSLLASMFGTRYFPNLNRFILLFEEIDERPYRIDRTLQQLLLGDVFHIINGVVLGKFVDCKPETRKPSLSIREILENAFRDFEFPILSGVHYGHVRNSLMIPLGIRIQISAKRTGLITFLESAVS